MNGPVCNMYSLKPIVQFSQGIELPSNMYKMKNIYSSFHDFKSDAGRPIENGFENKVENGRQIDAIEQRQSLILEQLKRLQQQMDTLKKQLLAQSSSIPRTISINTHQPAAAAAATTTRSLPNFSQEGVISDIVINANPSWPPYSLLGVQNLWKDSFNLKMSSYVHSSVVDLPTDNKQLLSRFNKTAETNGLPTLNITLVWKNIGTDCELIVSPLTNCTINGEVNVLRYLHRHLNPDGGDILKETLLDGFLDNCYCLTHATSQKEKSSIVRKLNAALGKSEWFGGNTISVEDLAAWSTIRNVGNGLELPQKLTKWMEHCNEHVISIA